MTNYNFVIFGMPIMIGIEGLHNISDMFILILYIGLEFSFPIWLVWYGYTEYRGYKKSLLQDQIQHGDNQWDPLTQIVRNSDSLPLFSSLPYSSQLAEEQEPLSISPFKQRLKLSLVVFLLKSLPIILWSKSVAENLVTKLAKHMTRL